MNQKHRKNLISRISILVALVVICAVLFTGCVSGMSPVGWSGVASSDGMLYTGSKEGRLVSINTNNNNALQFTDPLKLASSGSGSCGGSSSACGGSAAAVAIYGTPAIAGNVPIGVDNSGSAIIGSAIIIAGYDGKVMAYTSSNIKNIIWEFPKGGGYLSPIVSAITVSGNTLYFGCTDGNLYALDTALGNEKWRFSTGAEIWATPVVDNNIVFISSFDKKMYAVDAATGKEKWSFTASANNVSTPLTLDGVVYMGSLDRNFYALDINTGKELWKFTGGNWFWSKPVAVNGIVFAPCLDRKVYALDAKTGNKLAEYNVDGQVSSWPVIVNNKVIVATNNGNLYSLDSSNLNLSQQLVTKIPEKVTSPLSVVNEIVYINGPDNYLYAYNVITGEKYTPVALKYQ